MRETGPTSEKGRKARACHPPSTHKQEKSGGMHEDQVVTADCNGLWEPGDFVKVALGH